MIELLLKISAVLRDKYLAVSDSLLPPATNLEIEALGKEFNFPLPEQLEAVLRWANGSKLAFHNAFRLLGTSEIQDTYRILSDLERANTFELKNWWNVHWIPLLGTADGNYVCYDVLGTFGGRGGQLVMYIYNCPSRIIVAPSAREWLSCYLEFAEKGRLSENQFVGDMEVWTEGIDGFPREVNLQPFA